MTADERAERTERLKAQRVAAGRQPTIQQPAVYALLGAVIAAGETKTEK